MAYVFCFMSQDFYDRHHDNDEIESKNNRPHLRMLVETNGIKLAVPFRSNISHPYAFFLGKGKKRGLDFSKAIVIRDEDKDIDKLSNVRIRGDEFEALRGKESAIEQHMLMYLRAYANAKSMPDTSWAKTILSYSALQYFPEEEAILVDAVSNNKPLIIKV